MNWRAVIQMSVVALMCGAVLGCEEQPTPLGDQDQAVQTLRQYVRLRLRDVDWTEYSKFVTWPEEADSNCDWISDGYSIGEPTSRGDSVFVPVVYRRAGLFCYNIEFMPDPKSVTVNYELVKHSGGWKVNSPIPDYPDVTGDKLMKMLTAAAVNMNEPPGRRVQAEMVRHMIEDAIAGMPDPHEATECDNGVVAYYSLVPDPHEPTECVNGVVSYYSLSGGEDFAKPPTLKPISAATHKLTLPVPTPQPTSASTAQPTSSSSSIVHLSTSPVPSPTLQPMPSPTPEAALPQNGADDHGSVQMNSDADQPPEKGIDADPPHDLDKSVTVVE